MPRTIVTSFPGGFGQSLAAALQTVHGDCASVVTSAAQSRADLARAFAEVPEATTLVHAHIDPQMLVSEPLDSMTDDAWDARGELHLRHALHCIQAAFDAFGVDQSDPDRSRRLIAITPTIALLGAGGLVPASSAFEGVRSLIKSAARQWGAFRYTANCVAPPVEMIGAGTGAGMTPRPAAAALVPFDDAAVAVAEVITALLGPAGTRITGQTIIVDRGVVMR